MNTITKPNRQTHISKDLSKLSRSELLALKRQVDGEVAEIKLQFAQARLHLAETGQYADSSWHARANCALQFKGITLQAIQNELAQRKLEEKKPESLSTYFMTVAEHRLTHDVYTDIIAEARELLNMER